MGSKESVKMNFGSNQTHFSLDAAVVTVFHPLMMNSTKEMVQVVVDISAMIMGKTGSR